MRIFFFLLLGFSLHAEAWTDPFSLIYGSDDREDYYQIKSARIRALADSTAAQIPMAYLQSKESGQVHIAAVSNFRERYNVCTTEAFANQPVVADCTAFLIGPDLVATASHCIDETRCPFHSYIFGYHMQDDHHAQLDLSSDDVYSCKGIVVQYETAVDADFAIVRLDRPVKNRIPLKLRDENAKPIEVGAEVFTLGYPLGLPEKLGARGIVRKREGNIFVTNLDTYHVNSGSPVFNSSTYEVEGILVRGDDDFVFDKKKNCQVSKHCDDDACEGESVTDIGKVIAYWKNPSLILSTELQSPQQP